VKKILSLLLCALLFVSAALAEGMEAEPEAFEYLDKIPVNNMYTALEIEGIDHPVFAYEHADGLTMFRVYGQRGRKRGYYEAELLYENDAFELTVTGEAPRKDSGNSGAVAQSISRELLKVPKGWYFNYEKNMVYYIDVFGVENRFALGHYREGEVSYIPLARNNRFIKGALPIDPESVKDHLKTEAYNYKLPKEYSRGVQTKVFVYTSNAQLVSVPTYKPALDKSTLEINTKIKNYQRVRVGDSNADLLGIQKMLAALGYYAGDYDGVYGEGMNKGISLFQEQNGITPTGKPDLKTLQLLYFGNPAKNPNPVKAEDFEGNGVRGEKWKYSYLDSLGN